MSENSVDRRLAAVLVADVVGYTGLMEDDSDGTVAAWAAARDEVIEPVTGRHGGRVVKLTGDGFLAEFPTVQNAVNCARTMQDELITNSLNFRMGINLGDIIDDGRDIHGEGVNVAARIEALAEPGGICISGLVYESIRNRIDADYRDMGEREVKNVSGPVRVYAIGGGKAAVNAKPPADKPSIAVLPFDNLSDDAAQEYFSDGITEDIITDLSKVSSLIVIARNSSFTYKGKATDVRSVAADLNVSYLLEGSVRKAGEKVRITAQLVDGKSGAHIWADRYDRNMTDIFAVQDEVAQKIIEALQLNLSPEEIKRIGTPGTDNMEAYDYMLRGRDLLQRFTPDDSREAIIMFEKSIALDPNFAAPLGECAITMFNQYFSGWDNAGPEIFEKGQQLLARAVKLDPEDSNAQRVLAIGRLWSRDLDGALAAADRSISLDPNNAAALAARGNILGYAGRHDEAIENLTDAIRLDPHHFPIWLYFLAHSHVLKGEFGTAAHLLQQRIRRDPDTDISRALLASCYGLLGRAEEAREMWDEMLNINPDYSLAQKARVLPYKNPADWDFIVDGLRKAGIVKEETEE